MENFWDTPLGATIQRAWDEGENIAVMGLTPDGDRALIADFHRGQVTIAKVDTIASLGRWECSLAHYREDIALYSERFSRAL
jgi:succinate dehydrogenase/fumarate reductase flavoprotein subunit